MKNNASTNVNSSDKDSKKPKYFDIQTVIDDFPDTTAYVVVGQRGVGKSYSIKKYLLRHFAETGKKFIYCRRWTTDIQGKTLYTVFDDVMGKEEFKLPGTEGYKYLAVLPKSNLFYVVGYKDDNAKPEWLYDIGRITCVASAEKFKGGTYNDYDSIFFDEFITERGYINSDKEPEQFNKILYTVARSENDKVKVFLAGNPDSQIEMCPYLYDMALDYEEMEPNMVYKYNTIDTDGIEHENTKIFVKLAALGSDYLNMGVWGIWGRTSEDIMSATGSVKTNHYIHLTEQMDLDFQPIYCLDVETAILRREGYKKHVYVYLGSLWNEPMIVVRAHKSKSEVPTIFCRYDATEFKKTIERQIWRIAVPPLEEYAPLTKLLISCLKMRNIATIDDGAATIFETIYESSKYDF